MHDLLNEPASTPARPRLRRLAALLPATLLATQLTACGGDGNDARAAQDPGTGTSSSGGTPADEAFVKAAVDAVTATRAQARTCGGRSFEAAPAVTWSGALADAALAHSVWMRDTNTFSHTGENGSDVGGRAREAGYAWRTIGENIAAGQPDIASVVQAWRTSPEHCVNLMTAAFGDIGLARVEGDGGSAFTTYWTLVLGAR